MKAALILDEMPKKCIDCEYIFYNEKTDHYICGVPNNHIDIWNREIWTSSWIDKIERPDWCPLQEVELVRHGIYKMIVDNCCWFNECSVCGNRIEFGYMLTSYCPNCGAKMDGGAE